MARLGAVLSRSTLMMVRRVLHAYREGWLLEGRIARVARMVAEDARLLGLAAEQVLVALEPRRRRRARARVCAAAAPRPPRAHGVA